MSGTNTPIDMAQVRKELGVDQLSATLNDILNKQKQEEADKLAKQKAAEEEARIQALIEKTVGANREKLEEANQTIKTLEESLKTSNTTFADTVEAMQNTIIGLQDEIKQVMAARSGADTFATNAISKAMFGNDQEQFEKAVENVVLLSYITEQNMFETAYGAEHQKAVNSSSSIEVSSESYETIFSQRILRDIQKLLVVGDLFEELPMTSANLTMMIEPDSQVASWVAASTYGTAATTGNEIKAKLGEKTFKTFKLASKAYMTDETPEDAIVPLLPIIRRHLIESHVKAIENAFMTGDGSGKPLGLLPMAAADGRKIATTAKADGTVKVTAKMLHEMRRKLGQRGLDLSKLVLIVSMDAYYDLTEDQEFQDMSQVGGQATKLTGQVGRIYGMPVVVSGYFPAKAVDAEFAALVYKDNFVVPRQRTVTVERERRASEQRDAYYVTQRVNLDRLIDDEGVATAAYAAA